MTTDPCRDLPLQKVGGTGSIYTYYGPEEPKFKNLTDGFLKGDDCDLPKIMPALGLGDEPIPCGGHRTSSTARHQGQLQQTRIIVDTGTSTVMAFKRFSVKPQTNSKKMHFLNYFLPFFHIFGR